MTQKIFNRVLFSSNREMLPSGIFLSFFCLKNAGLKYNLPRIFSFDRSMPVECYLLSSRPFFLSAFSDVLFFSTFLMRNNSAKPMPGAPTFPGALTARVRSTLQTKNTSECGTNLHLTPLYIFSVKKKTAKD